MIQALTITQPDDWHLHLRDGAMLQHVLPYTSSQFGRAIIMPNLQPPVITQQDAQAYQQRILAQLPKGHLFTPLMTAYLTEQTDAKDLQAGFESGLLVAAKLYPAGATTNSDAGVKNIESIYPVLEVMEAIGMPLLVHGEVVDDAIDIFDREAVFIETRLIPIREQFPYLKIVFEHITTQQGVEYVRSCDSHTAATVTPHHLVINRNALLVGGVKPHYYCLPIAKREQHRLALVDAVTSGDAHFFLGTDSAPHLIGAKESACGCAGIFNVANAIPILAQVFEQAGALEHLEAFVAYHGAAFYAKPANSRKLSLIRSEQPQPIPQDVITEQGNVKAFDPLMDVYWKVDSVI